jgi:hypothetical protein
MEGVLQWAYFLPKKSFRKPELTAVSNEIWTGTSKTGRTHGRIEQKEGNKEQRRVKAR